MMRFSQSGDGVGRPWRLFPGRMMGGGFYCGCGVLGFGFFWVVTKCVGDYFMEISNVRSLLLLFAWCHNSMSIVEFDDLL